MVKKPNFKLIAKGQDITEKIAQNLLSLSFDDKAKDESDELSISLNGLYQRAKFGDTLELYLGYENLYKCGTFSVNGFSKDYANNTTQIKATAINFASGIKNKKSRSFADTNLGDIAIKIAGENNLKAKINDAGKIYIKHEMQNNISDIEFIYLLCAKYGFLASIKEQTLIIIEQKQAAQNGIKGGGERTGGIHHKVHLKDLTSLNINVKNRNNYTGVRLSYQDDEDASVKNVMSGDENGAVFELKMAKPRNENEALRMCEAKLNALNASSYEGSCSLMGANIKAGASLSIEGIEERAVFTIKDVRHDFSLSGYTISLNFEG